MVPRQVPVGSTLAGSNARGGTMAWLGHGHPKHSAFKSLFDLIPDALALRRAPR